MTKLFDEKIYKELDVMFNSIGNCNDLQYSVENPSINSNENNNTSFGTESLTFSTNETIVDSNFRINSNFEPTDLLFNKTFESEQSSVRNVQAQSKN